MPDSLSPIDYLVVGHITRDLLPAGQSAVGGTAAYAALTAVALGRRTGILTSTGPEWPPPGLLPTVSQFSVPAPATTTFENRYHDGQRCQYLHAVAATLTPDMLPAAWTGTPLIHLGPVAGECDPAWGEQWAGRAFLGLTPQGWMRQVDGGGRVRQTAWAAAARLLPLASAVVLSLEDVGGDWALAEAFARQTALLVVTQGRDGSTLFTRGQARHFPAPAVAEVDPTGAGDIFATAFFIALAGGTVPEQAIALATCLASRSVTRPGLAGVPTAADLAACMRQLESVTL